LGDVYISEPLRLPSITGKDVIDLEKYASLPRTRSYNAVEAFLEEARKSQDVNVRFIVAEWGEGKSSIYEGLLQKPDVIKSDLVIPISTRRLIVHIKEKGGLFTDTGSLGARFLACLLCAIKDVIDNELSSKKPFNEIKIRAPRPQETMSFIEDGLESIFKVLSQNARLFIFLDEFEDVVDEARDIRDFIRAGLVEVINGSPRLLIEGPFAGRLHMLISATPPAYEKLVSELPADARRLFGQRALKIELEKLDRRSAYQYILGILRYCWDGKLEEIPFTEPGMFNAIYISTLGNPRSIVNILRLLLMHAKNSAPEGKIKRIEPRDFVNTLLDQSIEVYGGEVHLMDKNVLNKLCERLRKKCRELGLSFEKCMEFVYLLLANVCPTSMREVGRRLGEDPYIYSKIIGSCFKELWRIEQPFLLFKKVISGLDKVKELPDAPPKLSKVIDALEFYDFDQRSLSLSSTIYIPYKKLRVLEFEDKSLYQNYIEFFMAFSSELSNEDEISISIDKFLFDNVEKSEEDYIMLSQRALNLFYPSPSFFFLDFIEDLDKRFKIGVELTRYLTSFEEELKEGVLQLLIDGGHGKGVKVEREIESSRTFKDVEVIKLSYSEVLHQYFMRARILPALRVSGDEFRKRVEMLLNEMKEARIPVLLVFSWNPLPLEAKNILETLLSPKRGLKRIFHYLEFPLSEFQCHQIIGYALAKGRNYNVREERWKARASRILEEIKFEEKIKEFVSKGIQDGYTTKMLSLKELKQDEVPGFLKTLLITEGSIKERWETITYLEERFRIYGRDFPICPKDIESITQFEKCIYDLKNNGFVEEEINGTLKVCDSPIEERIISILEEYGRPLSIDEIDDLFVVVSPPSSLREKFTTDIYLRILESKRRVRFDRKGKVYSLYDGRVLDEVRKIKERVERLKERYLSYPYGYLVSIKQRDMSIIIVKECIEIIEKKIESLEEIPPIPGYEEKRLRGLILLETLINQLNEITELSSEFWKRYSSQYDYLKRDVKSLKSKLEKLEEEINKLRITGKRLRLKEIRELNEKLAKLEEIKKRDYTRDEVKNLALKLYRSHELPKEFYEEYKNCPVFDVKIVQLVNENEGLRRVTNEYKELMREIEEDVHVIRELREFINQPKIFTSKYEGLFSSALKDWVVSSMRK